MFKLNPMPRELSKVSPNPMSLFRIDQARAKLKIYDKKNL